MSTGFPLTRRRAFSTRTSLNPNSRDDTSDKPALLYENTLSVYKNGVSADHSLTDGTPNSVLTTLPELSEQLAEEIKTEVIEQAIEEDLAVVYCGEVIETEDLEELKEEEQE